MRIISDILLLGAGAQIRAPAHSACYTGRPAPDRKSSLACGFLFGAADETHGKLVAIVTADEADGHDRSTMISDRRFAQLVRDHAGAVAAYARAVAPDRWTAEDAVQETFLRAWRYRDSFRATGSFEGWLIRICRNCLVDLAAKTVDQPTSEPPETSETSEGLHELYDVVARLPVNQREVVAVCAFLGYDYAGAAELLDVPIGTVRSRLHRARATIAAQLDEAGTELSA